MLQWCKMETLHKNQLKQSEKIICVCCLLQKIGLIKLKHHVFVSSILSALFQSPLVFTYGLKQLTDVSQSEQKSISHHFQCPHWPSNRRNVFALNKCDKLPPLVSFYYRLSYSEAKCDITDTKTSSVPRYILPNFGLLF